jgi:hypothetical protein
MAAFPLSFNEYIMCCKTFSLAILSFLVEILGIPAKKRPVVGFGI